MIRPLNELIGLPSTAAPTAVAAAAERQCELLFSKAANSDPEAQLELLKLHIAYLVWAYARPNTASRHASMPM